jgi:WD40 repeat protein
MSATPEPMATHDHVSPPIADAATLPPRSDGEPATLPPRMDAAPGTLPYAQAAGPAAPTVPGYELLGELGRGGMGVVYKARQVALNRVVALKMVLSGGHASPEELARFRSEAEAVARLQHPNIVQIHEVGEVGGLPYFSLEFCPGGSLAQKLDGTPLPPKQAAELVEKLAGAMHAAHNAGVVHRDLKPANVLLAADGTPKVTDFGLAKKLDATDGPTRSGAIMGTPSYMAPEQAGGDGKKVGPAADTYALGAILYELLTGRPPFKAATSLDTMLQVIEQEPVPPSRLNAQAPRDLETIALKCLNKQAVKRYDTAAALADDLRRWQNGEPIAARPTGSLERAAKWARRRPAVAALLALALVTVIIGVSGTWVFVTRLRQERDVADYERRQAEDQRKLTEDQRQRAEARELLARRYLHAATTNLAQVAWDQTHVGRVLELLEEMRPQPGQLDLRGFEWHYLQRLCHGELQTLHTGAIDRLAYSPDGARLAGEGRGWVRVWDTTTGRELLTLKGPTDGSAGVAFSPNGTRLASAENAKTVRVWDAISGEELAAFQGHTRRVSSVAFSPDGTRLASASVDGTVRIWDVATSQGVHTLERHRGGVNGVAYSPDGARLASAGGDGMIRIWDTATGRGLRILNGHTGGGPGVINVWGVAYSPDAARLASAGGDGTIRVWDAVLGKELAVLEGHKDRVCGVAYSPDGARLASASLDGTVRVWDAATYREYATIQGHTNGVHKVVYSPDGARLASAGGDGTIRVWDAATSRKQAALEGHTNRVNGVAYSPDSARLASAGDDGTVRVWDAVTSQELLTLNGHTKRVNGVAYSPDGARLASAGDDGTVRVWDAVTDREVLTITRHTGSVSSVAFSPDGQRLASATKRPDGTVRVWDALTGQELLAVKPMVEVYSVAFSPDGTRLAIAGNIGTVRVWDAATGREMTPLQGHQGSVKCVAYSPDGARLAGTGLDGTVRIWDTATGRELATLRGHTGNVVGLGYSPDGTRLASAGVDKTVRVWDAASGKELIALQQYAGWANCVMFSPDGTRLASAGDDGKIRVYDARAQTEDLRDERDALSRLEFLFDRPLLKDDVREFLRTDATISEPVRQFALTFLDQYRDDPHRLVRRPGGNAATYRRAVQLADAAYRLAPNDGKCLTTLGIAQYRAGEYARASNMLRRSRSLNVRGPGGDQPSDVAFLAMCHQQLGQPEQARKLLAELRALCQKAAWAKNEEAQAFLREAEAIIPPDAPRP